MEGKSAAGFFGGVAGDSCGRAGEVDFGEAREVGFEDGIFGGAVLEAGEVGGEFAGAGFFGRERVDHPVGFAADFDELAGFQVAEVFGDFDLRLVENLLEVADAERAVLEEVEDAKAGEIAQAFVDFDEVHARKVLIQEYSARRILKSWRMLVWGVAGAINLGGSH
jgi:hypothetical protein